jgi:hypothetical protein
MVLEEKCSSELAVIESKTGHSVVHRRPTCHPDLPVGISRHVAGNGPPTGDLLFPDHPRFLLILQPLPQSLNPKLDEVVVVLPGFLWVDPASHVGLPPSLDAD